MKRPQDALWRVVLGLRQRETWLAVVALILIGLCFWLLSEPLGYLLRQGDVARAWINRAGAWAPVAYISLFALQIIIAPLPGQFMGVMGGYIFGFLFGSLYSVTGLTIGATVVLVLARRYGRPLLERFFERDQLKRWERKLYMRSPVNWGLLFLFPVPDFVFYLAGLSSVALSRLLPAVIIGRGIGLVFANSVGGLTAHMSPEWVAVKWSILAGLSLLIYRNERKLRLYLLLSVRYLQQRWRQWARSPQLPV